MVRNKRLIMKAFINIGNALIVLLFNIIYIYIWGIENYISYWTTPGFMQVFLILYSIWGFLGLGMYIMAKLKS